MIDKGVQDVTRPAPLLVLEGSIRMQLQPQATIVFAGDSVTDMHRQYQAEPGGWDSWGDGYVALINAALTALYPELKLSVINAGINGNTVVQLAARFNSDVLAHQPDVVSIMIGINDVWRYHDSQFRRRNDLVDLDLYAKTLQQLVTATKARHAQVILMSPCMWELNVDDPMRRQLLQYQEIVKQIANANQVVFVNVQAAVDHFLQEASSYAITMDRVHPNLAGAMLIAKTWLDAVDFDWRRG